MYWLKPEINQVQNVANYVICDIISRESQGILSQLPVINDEIGDDNNISLNSDKIGCNDGANGLSDGSSESVGVGPTIRVSVYSDTFVNVTVGSHIYLLDERGGGEECIVVNWDGEFIQFKKSQQFQLKYLHSKCFVAEIKNVSSMFSYYFLFVDCILW